MSEETLDYIPSDDGYTLGAYIGAVPRLHNEVRIRFRPVDLIERAVLMAFKDRHNEKAITQKFCEVLAVKITEWSVVRKEGDVGCPMPINAESVQSLKPSLWIRLVSIIIWGVDGGDLDPATGTRELESQMDADMDAILAGNKIIDKRLDELRKN